MGYGMALAMLMAGLGASGCITGVREAENPNRAFDLPESDAVLIEWRECADTRPCIRGDWHGAEYALGFKKSPSVLAGTLGGKPIELAVDPTSVFSYGNRVVEMTFEDQAKTTVVALTWNEQDQRLIDAQLVQSDR